MRNIRIIFGLLILIFLPSNALPARLASMLKIAVRYTKATQVKAQQIKAQIREPWARAKHPAAIKFSDSRLIPTKKVLARRIAPVAFTGLATTAATVKYKEQQQREIKYNEEIVTIFAHGIKSSSKAGLHRHVNSQRPAAFIQGPLITFDFKDTVQASCASFGQAEDVNKLAEICNAYPDQRKILSGSSRGAATCINYLGTQQPTHIGAAVVESPFASLETLISPSVKPVFQWFFPHYESHGLQPVNSAPHIAKDIPIFIFCSKDDEVIPVSQTIQVYLALRASGHTKSHLLVVDNGAHAKILGNKDGQQVRNAIHAFYKEYNIPHNASWATQGQELFKQTNPSLEKLEEISAIPQFNSFMRAFKMSGGASGSR